MTDHLAEARRKLYIAGPMTGGYRPRCLVELGQDGEGTTVLNVTIAGLPAGDGVEFLGFLGECFSNMEAAGGEDR